MINYYLQQQRDNNLQTSQQSEVFENMINNLPGVVYEWYEKSNGEYGFSFLSKKAEKMFGVTIDSALELVKSINPDNFQVFRRSIQSVLHKSKIDGQNTWEYDFSFLDLSGDVRWVHATSEIVYHSDEVSIFQGIFFDITAKKKVEDKLLLSESRFRQIVDSTVLMMYITDQNFKEIYFNKSWLTFRGVTLAEALSSGSRIAVHPEDIATIRDIAWQARSKCSSFAVEYRLLRYDGVYCNVRSFASPEFDAHGKLIGYIGFVTDVTSEISAIQALKESEERFRLIAEYAPVFIWQGDEAGNRTYVNKQFSHFTGFTFDEHLGVGWKKAHHPRETDWLFPLLATKFQNHEQYTIEYQLKRFDGEYRWFKETAIPRFDTQNNFRGFISTCLDIHDLHTIANENKELVNRLQVATNASGIGIWDYNIETNKLFWDSQQRTIYGVEQNDLNDFVTDWYERLHPEDRDETIAKNNRAFQGNDETVSYQFRIIRKNDEKVRYLKAFGRILRDSTGKAERVIGTNWDVTEQVLAEEHIRSLHERLELVTNTAQIGIFDLNTKTGVHYWNDQMYLIHGYEPQSISVQNIMSREFIFPEDLHFVEHALQEDLHRSGEIFLTFRIIRKNDQVIRYVEVFMRMLIQSIHGKTERVIGTVLDVTDREMMQKREKEQRQLLSIVASSIPQILFIFNCPSNTFLYKNRPLGVFLGYSEEESFLLRSNFYDQLHHVDDKKKLRDFFEEAKTLQPLQTLTCEYRLRSIKGEFRWFSTKFMPLSYRNEILEQFLGITEDITEQKEYEEKLIMEREKSEQANRAKTVFLSNITHELRTPLNAVLGFAQVLLNDRTISDKNHEIISTMHRSGSYLLQLLNDILDISRIETDKLYLVEEDFNLPLLLRDVLAMFLPAAESKHISIQLHCSKNLPIIVNGDPKRLRQILINLIGNAVKYTSVGWVHVNVSSAEIFEKKSSNSQPVYFEVIDTGKGIPEHEIPLICQPFHQVATNANTSEGSGLGLAITSKLLRLLHSELHIESKEHIGSRFSFVIDFKLRTNDPTSIKQDREMKSLIVVDNHFERRSKIREFCTTFGFLCEGISYSEYLENSMLVNVHDIVFLIVDQYPVEEIRDIFHELLLHPLNSLRYILATSNKEFAREVASSSAVDAIVEFAADNDIHQEIAEIQNQSSSILYNMRQKQLVPLEKVEGIFEQICTILTQSDNRILHNLREATVFQDYERITKEYEYLSSVDNFSGMFTEKEHAALLQLVQAAKDNNLQFFLQLCLTIEKHNTST